MKKYKVAVIGDFAKGEKVYSGQTAKVRDYYYYLVSRYGEDQVLLLDTRGWQKKVFSYTRQLFKACKTSENVVPLLCANGLSIKTVFPIILSRKRKYGYKVLYSVVGGALITEYEKNKYIRKHLKDVEAVYVETKALQNMLDGHGHTNIRYAPVFSRRPSKTDEDVAAMTFEEPFRFCTYARVSKEKGISDAIDAVTEVNRRYGRTVCVLDVYGPPVKGYKEEFDAKVNAAPDMIFSQGLLTDENAIDELSKHYLMLFPTYYEGEGFPIALMEAMKAALPVVATDWHYNSEIVEDGKSGVIYNRDKESLADIIEGLLKDPEKVKAMREYSLMKSKSFDPEMIMSEIYKVIDGETK